jgi:lipopolysaccharide export system protein LptA
VLFLGSLAASAESKDKATEPIPENEPIQITANQLISNNDEKFAEFIGDVKASQGNFMITSDRLKIYYEGDLVNPEKKSSGDEVIKKIVAEGNVKITAEQYLAETDQVEYDTDSMTIVLHGENSKVTSGKNSISGSKITLYRKDGQVKVEGSAEKRIKAVFYSTGKTSDVLNLEPSDGQDTPPTP